MKAECPRCGEIALVIAENGQATCSCGHYEQHTAGFDEFLHKLGGYDAIDNLGTIDCMKLAFLGGRTYESQRDLEKLRDINERLLEI